MAAFLAVLLVVVTLPLGAAAQSGGDVIVAFAWGTDERVTVSRGTPEADLPLPGEVLATVVPAEEELLEEPTEEAIEEPSEEATEDATEEAAVEAMEEAAVETGELSQAEETEIPAEESASDMLFSAAYAEETPLSAEPGVMVAVTWEAEPEYNSAIPGEYRFTASPDDSYILSAEAPVLTVTVEESADSEPSATEEATDGDPGTEATPTDAVAAQSVTLLESGNTFDFSIYMGDNPNDTQEEMQQAFNDTIRGLSSGDEITVSGILSISDTFTVNIPDGVRVLWDAIKPVGQSEASFTGDYIQVTGDGDFVVTSGGVIDSGSLTDTYAAINADVDITIDGGRIRTSGDGIAIKTAGDVTVNRGNVSARNGTAIQSGGTVTVGNDGNADSDLGTAIDSQGSVTVNGGYVNSNEGIAIKSGDSVTVNGGTVHSNESIAIKSGDSVTVSDGGWVKSNDNIAIDAVGSVEVSNSEVSGGDITINTAGSVEVSNSEIISKNNKAINITGSGAVVVRDGSEVTSGTTNFVIYAAGDVTVNDSAVENTKMGGAIYSGNGDIEISGSSTVHVEKGPATGIVIAFGSGKTVTVSGGTVSGGTGSLGSTIRSGGTVNVSGGTVSSQGATRDVIYADNAVNISGDGRVLATVSAAIDGKPGSVNVSVSGGVVFSSRGSTVDGNGDIIKSGFNGVTGNGVVVGWNSANGNTNYTQGSSDDITASAGAKAVWEQGGIQYKNGPNTGLIPLAVDVAAKAPVGNRPGNTPDDVPDNVPNDVPDNAPDSYDDDDDDDDDDGNDSQSSAGSRTSSAASNNWIESPKMSKIVDSTITLHADFARSSNSLLTGVRGKAFAVLAASGLPYTHDTVTGTKVDLRVYIDDPALFTQDTLVSGQVRGKRTDSLQRLFEKWYPSAGIRAISFDQQGMWESPIKAAARLDLTGVDTAKLYFYSYDKPSNRYKPIANPMNWFDGNGYLRFTTAFAGDIIVSDTPLSSAKGAADTASAEESANQGVLSDLVAAASVKSYTNP